MFTLTVYLVQRGMLAEMMKSAPPGMPNVFLLDMTPRNRDAVVHLIAHQPGVEKRPETVGTVAATHYLHRWHAVGARQSERHRAPLCARRLGQRRRCTAAVHHAGGRQMVGRRNSTEPRVSVSEEAAKILNLASRLAHGLVHAQPPQFTAVVAAVHKTENIRLTARIEFFFPPDVLEGLARHLLRQRARDAAGCAAAAARSCISVSPP